MRGAGLVERCADLLVARHIDFAKDAANLGCDLFSALDVAVEHGDFGALGGKRPRSGFAKPRCAARYDC